MSELWENSLRRLASQFLQASLHQRISTLVIHAKNTAAGKKALAGPPAGHWLRDVTGIGEPSFTAAFATYAGQPWPERAIYFGGEPEADGRFMLLCNQAGGLLDVPDVEERVPKGLYASVFSTMKGQAATVIAWVFLIHELGLQRREDAAFDLEPQTWDEDSVQAADNWASGQIDGRLPFFFTYSSNTCEHAAATIDVLLSVPPRDTWITIADAARALNMNDGQVSRDAVKLGLRTIGGGRSRRVSPASVIEAIIRRNRSQGGREPDETDAEVQRKFDRLKRQS